jgi:hypothetical protein
MYEYGYMFSMNIEVINYLDDCLYNILINRTNI